MIFIVAIEFYKLSNIQEENWLSVIVSESLFFYLNLQ